MRASCSKCLILLGTSRSAGHRVDLRLLSLMHAALVCQSRDLLLTLSQHLIGHRQLLKTLRVLHTKLLDIGRIGWAVSKRGELLHDCRNQLVVVVPKGRLHSGQLFEISNMLTFSSNLRSLDLRRRHLRLWLGLPLRIGLLRLLRMLRLLRFRLPLLLGLTDQLLQFFLLCLGVSFAPVR